MKKNRIHRSVLCAASFGLAATGCSGGTHSFTPAPAATAAPNATPASKAGTSAKLTILVPRPVSGTAARRRPAYVSPSSTALNLAVNGGAVTTYGLTPNSPGCAVQSAVLACTFAIVAPAGNDSLALSLLDGAGNVLSRNVVSAQIAAGTSTPVSVTLDGVPASVAVVPGTNAFVDTSTPPYHVPGLFALPVEVEPLDADGNVIIGPGAPQIDAVSVSSGTAYATVASAGSTDPAAYVVKPKGGAAGGQTIAVSATVKGLMLGDGTVSQPVTASSTFTFTPALVVASGRAVTAVSVESGAPFAQFSVCPGECGTNIANDLASDASGNIYVDYTTLFGPAVNSNISVFPSGATVPANVLAATNGVHSVGGIYIDSQNALWVANGNTGSFGRGTHTPPAIAKFAPLASSPELTIANTFSQPGGIAVDGSGNVFESDPFNTATVVEYPSGSSTVSATLSDPSLAAPSNLATDASGGLYVIDATNDDIAYFAAGQTALTSTLTDSSFANGIDDMLVDPSGNLWVSLGPTNTIERLDHAALPGSVVITEIIDTGGAMGWIP
jgi:hypothetical protein